MPYLDICRLFFDAAATIADEASLFGEGWRLTLNYVLSQPGLEAAYTSKPSVQDGLWVFLVWQTEEDRNYFFHQTTGFGFASGYMTNTPAVYLFGEDAYDALDATNTWVIDVVVAAKADIVGEEEKQDLQLQPMSRYTFVGQQEQATAEMIYQGNHFGDAIFGLMHSDHSGEEFAQSKHTCARYILEMEKCAPALYPDCRTTEVPVNIAGLIEMRPWEYGLISYDTSIYSSLDYPSTAHPLNLTFQPMSTMDVPDEPLGELEHCGNGDLKTDKHHIMCMLSLSESPIRASKSGDKAVEEIRNKFGLRADTQGLREVRVLLETSHEDDTQTTRLICTWHSSDDLERWQRAATSHEDVGLECSWYSKRGDLSLLEWDNMPLTPDFQSYQELDKILEVVEFTFERGLSPVERKDFERRVYEFISTMSSEWGCGVDERPVVFAEEPVWILSEGSPSRCLLLVAWDGVEQREAWFRNFMANGFNWTGHLAHMLGSGCTFIESTTYDMVKLHVEQIPLNIPGGVGDSSDGRDSDSDMDF